MGLRALKGLGGSDSFSIRALVIGLRLLASQSLSLGCRSLWRPTFGQQDSTFRSGLRVFCPSGGAPGIYSRQRIRRKWRSLHECDALL